MKKLVVLAAALLGTLAPANSTQAQGIAGEWTRCVAWNNGTTYNIVNGQSGNLRCFDLARRCTGNPNVAVTYYTPAVIVNAPYTRCTLR